MKCPEPGEMPVNQSLVHRQIKSKIQALACKSFFMIFALHRLGLWADFGFVRCEVCAA
jgi:hypothetical protein